MPSPPLQSGSRRHTRIIAAWLLLGCALVAATLVVGGVTRLTGSGLSMVDWEPVSGVVPPMSAEGWEREFAAYRDSPEYRLVNRGMSLAEFKRIFWFEYAHRLLGRVIGLVFIIPFAVFLVRRMIPRSLIPRLLLLFALGGAQGLLGWWMVRSGLVDIPRVSPYRLTAHLALAVLVYALTLWTALSLLRPGSGKGDPEAARSAGLRRGSAIVLGLAALTLLSGGFVAGLDAGLIYNTFPRMGDGWIPPDLFGATPWWLSPFEDRDDGAVQPPHPRRAPARGRHDALVGLRAARPGGGEAVGARGLRGGMGSGRAGGRDPAAFRPHLPGRAPPGERARPLHRAAGPDLRTGARRGLRCADVAGWRDGGRPDGLGRLNGLEERHVAEAARGAHADDRARARGVCREFKHGLGEDARSGGAEGVPERDAAAVGIDPVAREGAETLLHGGARREPLRVLEGRDRAQDLGRERLVELPQPDVLQRESVAVEQFGDREGRGDEEPLPVRIDRGLPPVEEACAREGVGQQGEPGLGRDPARGGPVRERGRVARRERPVGAGRRRYGGRRASPATCRRAEGCRGRRGRCRA